MGEPTFPFLMSLQRGAISEIEGVIQELEAVISEVGGGRICAPYRLQQPSVPDCLWRSTGDGGQKRMAPCTFARTELDFPVFVYMHGIDFFEKLRGKIMELKWVPI